MAEATDLEQLAALCVRQQTALQKAGRSLHDHAGPLLSAAGIHLQLLAMDVPAARARAEEIAKILEQALDNVRSVSRALAPSPVYRGGLQRALAALAEEIAESAPVEIRVDYSVAASVPREVALPVYEAAAITMKAAVRQGGAKEIEIHVRDRPALHVKITDNGRPRGRAKALSIASLLAQESGLQFSVTQGKSTIVSIRPYGIRRSSR